MSTIPLLPSDAENVLKWTNRAIQDTINNETLPGMLVSKGILRRQNELQTGAGQSVTVTFSPRLRGLPQIGMEAAAANAVDGEYVSDVVTLNEVHKTLRWPAAGTIGRQYTDLDIPEDQYQRGVNYMRERLVVSILNQLAGNNATSIVWDGDTYTSGTRGAIWGFNTPTAPSSTRVYRPNSLSTDQAVNADTTATARLSHILALESMAELNRSYVQPLELDGGVKYLYLVHTKVFDQLQSDTTDPYQMRDIHLARIAAGTVKAGVFGREFDFSQTRIMSLDKLPYGVHSSTLAAQTNTRRGLFLGKDSGAIVFGKGHSAGGNTTPGFMIRRDDADVKRWELVNMSLVYGVTKLVFDSVDYALMTTTHYVP